MSVSHLGRIYEGLLEFRFEQAHEAATYLEYSATKGKNRVVKPISMPTTPPSSAKTRAFVPFAKSASKGRDLPEKRQQLAQNQRQLLHACGAGIAAGQGGY